MNLRNQNNQPTIVPDDTTTKLSYLSPSNILRIHDDSEILELPKKSLKNVGQINQIHAFLSVNPGFSLQVLSYYYQYGSNPNPLNTFYR